MGTGDKATLWVRAEWDAEAQYWYVADSNVAGLATGAATVPELIERLHAIIPELIELNALSIPAGAYLDLDAHYSQPMRLTA